MITEVHDKIISMIYFDRVFVIDLVNIKPQIRMLLNE